MYRSDGGWSLGCRIDGGQAEYVRVPYANQGLTVIPDNVSDEQALFVGDILQPAFGLYALQTFRREYSTDFWRRTNRNMHNALRIVKISKEYNSMRKRPTTFTVCPESLAESLTVSPEHVLEFTRKHSNHGGADRVFEAAGADETFQLAWQCARPNATITIPALYDRPQILPLPDMYGKNLTFQTGGVDGCDCSELLQLISEGKLDTTKLITHIFPLKEIDTAYKLFEEKTDGVFKIAIKP